MRNTQHRQVGVMAPDRWDRLLRAAAQEFAQAGYEQAFLNRIIRACGLSKSSFYHYVASKEQLFERVLWTYGPALVEALKLPRKDVLAGDFWGESNTTGLARASAKVALGPIRKLLSHID